MTPSTSTSRTGRKLVAVAALVLVALPTLAYAAVGRQAHRAPGAFKRLVRRLDLTPEQIDQIRGILAGHKDELAAEIAAVAAARNRLFDTIHAETFDETAIRHASAAVGAAEADLAVTRGEIVQEVRPVLTPEQQDQLAQMVAGARAFIETFLETIQARLAGLGG